MYYKVRYSILIGIGFLIANLPGSTIEFIILCLRLQKNYHPSRYIYCRRIRIVFADLLGQYDTYDNGLGDFNREYQHVYSGQSLARPMVNGTSSYYPKATKVLYDHIELAKTSEALYEACSRQAIDILILNKRLSIQGDER